MVRDVPIGIATGAAEGFAPNLYWTIGLDAAGSAVDSGVSQGLDSGWSNIDPGQVAFSGLVGGEVGLFGYIGEGAEPLIEKWDGAELGEEARKEVGYNALYGGADFGLSFCNTYNSVLKQGSC